MHRPPSARRRPSGTPNPYFSTLSMHALPRAITLAVLIAAQLGFFGARPAMAGDIGCRWSHGFEARGFDNEVFDLVSWDDGSGEALYAAGNFEAVSGRGSTFLAEWDGETWQPVTDSDGGGLEEGSSSHNARALAVWDDGGGEALFVAGRFDQADGQSVGNIARWNGRAWSSLTGPSGTGTDGVIYALAVWDDGTGEKLYAAGDFEQAGGVASKNIAAWDGSEWHALPNGGLSGPGFTLGVWDAGAGESLYVGGDFHQTEDGTVELERVARWDGSAWSGLQGVIGLGVDGIVRALLPGPSGLLVAGAFDEAGGVAASRLGVWDGEDWSAYSTHVFDDEIFALAVWDDGQGTRLYAAGAFDQVGAASTHGFSRWNGADWQAVDSGLGHGEDDPEAYVLSPFDDGTGEALHVAGDFTQVGSRAAGYIARWTGEELEPLPATGMGVVEGNIEPRIEDMVVWDDGNGEALFAVGEFGAVGEIGALYLARWNGQRWAKVGDQGVGIFDGDRLHAAIVWQGDLYVAGRFVSIDGASYGHIARWDGLSWSALTGSSGTGVDNRVLALAVWDDGSGEALYVGGLFSQAGGLPASRIAKWDGAEWSALGSGADGAVLTMVPWDDGTGEKLHVGGSFVEAGGSAVHRLATWDGGSWSAISTAGGTGADGTVEALLAWNGDLYFGGHFGSIGGTPANRVARYDGSAFSALIEGELDGVRMDVEDLAVHDDGTGEALYLGGQYDEGVVDGADLGSVGRWDGSAWSALDAPFGEVPVDQVLSLASFDAGHAGGAPALFAGGELDRAGGLASGSIGMWACDAVAPSAPMLDSPTHEVAVWSSSLEITVEWQGAMDTGQAGIHGYSYLFDRGATTEPDARIEVLHEERVQSFTSETLVPGDDHYFHLRTCDRSMNCTTSHLGPFWVDDGSYVFADGFESGGLEGWSASSP